jgi:antitoxin component of MazEF toxin-antitoxin module
MKEPGKEPASICDDSVAQLANTPTYELESLLAMITPENLPTERDWIDAAPLGGEVY